MDGSGGGVTNHTVYRVTPRNMLGLANKNTGDAAGDVMFALSRVNLPQLCRADPSYKGCLMNDTNDEIVMAITLESDGVWGPYFECNLVPNATSVADARGMADAWFRRAGAAFGLHSEASAAYRLSLAIDKGDVAATQGLSALKAWRPRGKLH